MKFCPSCGAQRLTETPLCASCGADLRRLAAAMVAPAPTRPGRKTVLALVALAAVVAGGCVFAGCSSSSGATASTPGGSGASTVAGASTAATSALRATPEDAVRQYLAGVAANDINRVLDACAIDEVAAHFQFDLQAERLQAIVPTTFLLPSGYQFYAGLNRYGQAYPIFAELRGLSYSLLSSQPVDQIITPVTADQAQKLIKDLDPSRLAGLTVASVKFPIAKFATDAHTISNFAAEAKVYGADELTERLALFQLNGQYYDVGFTLVRYGSDWKVLNQVSNLAAMPATGAAQQTTPGNFDAATGG
jgi:hypothetical protein